MHAPRGASVMLAPAPHRVLLFERITCTLADGLAHTFPEPWLRRASAEERCDAFLRQLRGQQGAWEWRMHVEISAEQGQTIHADVVIDERVSSIRQTVAEKLLTTAHEADKPFKEVNETADLVQRLLGRSLAPSECPPALKPIFTDPSPTLLMDWTYLSTITRPVHSTHSTCACGRPHVPHLRAYQRGRPVMVMALHTAKNAELGPGLCAYVARMWALIDVRDPTPLHSPAQPQDQLPMGRSQWLEQHLASVPVELGGPQADQLLRILDALGPGGLVGGAGNLA